MPLLLRSAPNDGRHRLQAISTRYSSRLHAMTTPLRLIRKGYLPRCNGVMTMLHSASAAPS